MMSSPKTLNTFRGILVFIERYYPGLADDLVIMTIPEGQTILNQGKRDVGAGRLIPLKQVLATRH
jgi:hypothetical protein